MITRTNTNISTENRVKLLLLSIGMIVVTLHTGGILGWHVIFPLVSIYAGITAFTGFDPIDSLISLVIKSTSRVDVPRNLVNGH
ncbi:MAG: hypothetical protein AB7R40_26220 [Nitrospiraceae bacterium]